MIKVTVLSPNEDGKKFDMTYYMSKHIPMVREKLAPTCKGVHVDKGLGGAGSAKAPYVAMAHLHFDSVEAFQGALGPHSDQIMGDIPNYTNIAPIIQISEITA